MEIAFKTSYFKLDFSFSTWNALKSRMSIDLSFILKREKNESNLLSRQVFCCWKYIFYIIHFPLHCFCCVKLVYLTSCHSKSETMKFVCLSCLRKRFVFSFLWWIIPLSKEFGNRHWDENVKNKDNIFCYHSGIWLDLSCKMTF